MTRRVAFFVDTTSGEPPAAARALGRALRRHGSWRTAFVPSADWRRAPADTDVAVVMMPTLDPSRLSAGAMSVAWLHAEVDRWLARPDLAAFDLVLAPSRLVLSAIRDRRVGESALLLPAADGPWAGLRRLRRPSVAVCRRGPDREYGVVGADLLRALAAGVLPVTDSGLGLADLGLAELPVFRTGADLRRGARTLARDGNATGSLVRRLGAEVRERHSWRRRAADFAAHVERARQRGAGARTLLGFYPDFRATNAFQDMLYSRARDAGVDVLPVPSAVADPAPHLRGRPADRYVLHVHWTSAVLGGADDEARQRLGRFQGRVRDLKTRGGTLVWTVHNVVPHENRYPELDLRLNRFLAEQADLIHVMNPDTAALTQGLYELPADRTRLIPHASYLGIYPDAVSRGYARHRLGIPPSDIVVLYAGSIRPYKGVDVLLDAFDAAVDDDPRLRLIVTGRVNQFAAPDAERLVARVASQRRCLSRLEHVPDDELQIYYRAADVAVLPYRSILNSGTLLLSLSFAVPVLAPALPSLRSLLDPAWSETFEPGSVEDLRRGLLAARRLADAAARSAAWQHAAAYRPQQMSEDFFAALEPVLNHAPVNA